MAKKQFVFYLYKVLDNREKRDEVLYREEFEAGSIAKAKRDAAELYDKWCEESSQPSIGFNVWDKIIPFEQIDGRVVTGFVCSTGTKKDADGVYFKLRQCIYYEQEVSHV